MSAWGGGFSREGGCQGGVGSSAPQAGCPGRCQNFAPHLPEPSAVDWPGREASTHARMAETPAAALRSHPELQGDGGHILAGDAPHAAGTNVRSRWSLEPSRGGGENRPCGSCCVLGGPAPSRSGVQGEQPLLQPPAGSG